MGMGEVIECVNRFVKNTEKKRGGVKLMVRYKL